MPMLRQIYGSGGRGMNLENSIKSVIEEKLVDGTVEKLVAEHLEKGVTKALESLFSSYGDVTKVIEKQIKSVMVPYLEKYDYSTYISKLDSVLIEVLQNSALENKKLLENFKGLMIPIEDGDIKVTDVFGKWKEYVANNVETDELEIDYDDYPSYEFVEVTFTTEYGEGRDWTKYEQAIIFFECEHDETMNIKIPIHRFSDINTNWTIDYKSSSDINTLRNLNEFEVYLMKLTQGYGKLVLDSEFERDEVRPEKEPEAHFE